MKLRHGALLGECCAAASLLSSPSAKSVEELLKGAREFGVNWASLSRLLSEFDFVKELRVWRWFQKLILVYPSYLLLLCLLFIEDR